MIRALTSLATVAALAVSAAPASAGTSMKPPPRDKTRTLIKDFSFGIKTQLNQAQHVSGIIMRDGGICDPIRHIGC